MNDQRTEKLRRAAERHEAAGRLASARILLAELEKAGAGSATDPRRSSVGEAGPAESRATIAVAARFAAQGRFSRAIDAYQKIIADRPKDPGAYINLSSLYRSLGRLEDAVATCRAGLKARSDDPSLNFNLGVVLHESGRPGDAVAAYGRAVANRPDWPEAFYNLGAVAVDLDRDSDAVDFYRQALALRPDYAEAANNLGNVLRDLGRLDEALSAFDQALDADAGHPNARFNRALAKLTAGDYRGGWVDYATRFNDPKIARLSGYDDFGLLRWDGARFDGKTLLVQSEQGSGDTLQFARYLPEVKARGGRVLFYCQPSLCGLLKGIDGADDIVARVPGKPPPAADVQVPLMDLPPLFGTEPTTIPTPAPYVAASAAARRRWADWDMPEGFSVGLVWSGNPRNKANRHRSLPLDRLLPLTQVPGTSFVSLQKGTPAAELIGSPLAPYVRDAGPDLHSFDDTAALIGRLDLIVTVCTSVAHLAGAMGAPCWTLLHHVPDWRWGASGEESAWYPGMRLFRQSRRGNWDDVIGRVTAALAEQVKQPTPAGP